MRSQKESKNPLVRPPHCTFHSNNRLQTLLSDARKNELSKQDDALYDVVSQKI